MHARTLCPKNLFPPLHFKRSIKKKNLTERTTGRKSNPTLTSFPALFSVKVVKVFTTLSQPFFTCVMFFLSKTATEGGSNLRMNAGHHIHTKMCERSAQRRSLIIEMQRILFECALRKKAHLLLLDLSNPCFGRPPPPHPTPPPLPLLPAPHRTCIKHYGGTLKACLRCLNSSLPAEAWGAAQPGSLVDRL